MRKILFVEVKSDVRSALNRLNTNWPQTRQDFAVDDVEENCHQEPCPTLEMPVKKKINKNGSKNCNTRLNFWLFQADSTDSIRRLI